MRSHQLLDDRSRALHQLVAAKIRQNPALFFKAASTLKRWQQQVAANSQPYLQEWEQLLSAGMETCLAVAVEDSEYAANLRQASPFTGILTHQERFAFLKEWSQSHATQ